MNEPRHFQFRLATLFAVTFGAAVFTWAAMRFPTALVWLPLQVLMSALFFVVVALLVYLVFGAYVLCLHVALEAARLTRFVVVAGVICLLQLGKRALGFKSVSEAGHDRTAPSMASAHWKKE